MTEQKKRTIFDLFEEVRKEMNRFFDDFMEMPFEARPHDVEKRELSPLTQITETEAEVIVTVDLPCVRKEDIKINATSQAVRIEAPMRECVKLSPFGVGRPMEFDNFRKTIILPAHVDPTNSRVRFKNGVLQMRFNKKIEGTPIKVE